MHTLKQWLSKLFFYFYYWGQPPWDTGISPPELWHVIERKPPGRALDMGCGTGTNAITLAKHGWHVIGVDFIGKAIASARRKAQDMGVTNVQFFVDDVSRLQNVQGTFDLILDIGCLHSLSAKAKQRYIQRLPHLLADEGIYLLYAFFRNKDQPNGLTEEDIRLLDEHLLLVERQNGTERGLRPSAWFTYRRRNVNPPDMQMENSTSATNTNLPSGNHA